MAVEIHESLAGVNMPAGLIRNIVTRAALASGASERNSGAKLAVKMRQSWAKRAARRVAQFEGVGDSKAHAREAMGEIVSDLHESGLSMSTNVGAGDAVYGSNTLRVDGPAIMQPSSPLEIENFVMERRVNPAAKVYTRRVITPKGRGWAPYRGGETVVPVVGHDATEQFEGLHIFIAGTYERWMQRERDVLAGWDSVGFDRETIAQSAAEFRESFRLRGVTGLAAKSLAGNDRVNIRRYSSGTVMGSGTTANQMLAAASAGLRASIEGSKGVARHDGALVSARLFHRFESQYNFDNGGSGSAAGAFLQMFANFGIRPERVQMSYNSMCDINGDGRDGILLTGSDAQRSLARIEGMDLAPVQEQEITLGNMTIWAMVLGGLEAPTAESAALLDFQIGA